MIKKLLLGLLIIIAFIFGMYFQKFASNKELQKTIERRYVKLKEERNLIPIGKSRSSLNLPKGMIIYFDYSHKDFHSYASIPIKTDFDVFIEYIENSDEEIIYELK